MQASSFIASDGFVGPSIHRDGANLPQKRGPWDFKTAIGIVASHPRAGLGVRAVSDDLAVKGWHVSYPRVAVTVDGQASM